MSSISIDFDIAKNIFHIYSLGVDGKLRPKIGRCFEPRVFHRCPINPEISIF
jgi:hypothetical protein